MAVSEGRALLVLLVDDDPDLLQLAEEILEQEGLRVVTASNGRRALKALELFEPDVIVLDMVMPEVDGFAFIREYALRPGSHAPILAISSFRGYLDQAFDAGATAVLEKPYGVDQLISAVFDLADDRAPTSRAPSGPREDEEARLRALLEADLEHPEPGMETFLDDVAQIFGVPISGVSAVTHDRQRLVVQCTGGPRDPGGPRETSFCSHAIAARAALVIQDARENPLFRDNPSVTERGFRFYAGVPLMAAQGEAVGTLCILDFQSHTFTYWDLELLGVLSRRVLAALDRRACSQRTEAPDSAYRYLDAVDDALGIYGKSLFSDLVVTSASRALQQRQPISLAALAASPDRLPSIVEALRGVTVGGLMGRLGLGRLGVVFPGCTPDEARDLAARAAGDSAQVVTTDLSRYQGATGLALRHVEQSLGDAGLG